MIVELTHSEFSRARLKLFAMPMSVYNADLSHELIVQLCANVIQLVLKKKIGKITYRFYLKCQIKV